MAAVMRSSVHGWAMMTTTMRSPYHGRSRSLSVRHPVHLGHGSSIKRSPMHLGHGSSTMEFTIHPWTLFVTIHSGALLVAINLLSLITLAFGPVALSPVGFGICR